MDENDREKVEEMAALQFTDAELATIFLMDADEFVKKYRSAIDRGRLLAEAEVRKSLAQLAKQGSTPAQKQFMELNHRAKQKRK